MTVGLVPPRTEKTKVYVYVGPPGCGKSKHVWEACGGKDFYYKPRGEWWDGFTNQSNVILDDFYGWIKYDEMLRICDRYPLKVPVKGSFVEFSAKNLYITSNTHVWEWYKFDGFDAAALMRRVNEYKLWYNDRFIDLYEVPFVTSLKYNY